MLETSYPSFGCCAFWKECQLGEGTCHYKVSNPVKMAACGAYKRHQKQPIQQEPVKVEAIVQPQTELKVEPVVEVMPQAELQTEPKVELIVNDNGQLSLF